MNHKKTSMTVAVLSSVLTISATGAMAPTPALRDRMAGAWRGTGYGDVFNIDGDLCIMAQGNHQMILTLQFESDVARRTNPSTGLPVPGELALREGMLVLRIPSQDIEVIYSRLDTVPDSVRVDPYKLGTRSLDSGQLAAIRREIAQRSKEDQDVRMKFAGAGAQVNDPADLHAMVAVDRENTLRLIKLIQDVGWLDVARFGKETQLGAFLIVQHSGSLRLMRTVLPLIEEEAKADRSLGQYYALLYDRLQMSVGKKQRYGTQMKPNPTGGMTIGRLEDRNRVDEWRKEMGMQSLADYMRMASERNGTKVSIGE